MSKLLISVRLTPDELRLLDRAAKQTKKTRSHLLRVILREKLGLPPTGEDNTEEDG